MKRKLTPVVLLAVLLSLQCRKNKNDNNSPDIEKGLQAWFKLDNSFDDAHSSSTATGHDGPLTFVADRKGNAKSAVSCEGGYFWFDFPDEFPAIPMSVSVWIKPKNLQTDAYLLKASTSAFGIHQLSDRVGFVVSTPATDGFASNFTSEWSHITGTYDGTSVRLYINGIHKGFELNPGEPDHSTRVEMGSLENFPFKWEGIMDDIRFYNRVLSEQEIKLLATP